MQGTENRIAALEQANPPREELTIIRHFVSPGHVNDEILRICGDGGQLWERLPGETEKELFDRAKREVKRNELGIAQLSADDGE
jgi:hypothetical protein